MEKLTAEQLQAKKQYAGEKKPSMKRRAEGHDYTGRRMYMITLEVEGRRPLFGRLKGNPFAAAGSSEAPQIELTALGKAVENEWWGIHGYYPQIEVRALQMMPDHLHGILFVQAELPLHLGQVIAGFKAGCRRAQRDLEQVATTFTGIAAAKPLPTEKWESPPQSAPSPSAPPQQAANISAPPQSAPSPSAPPQQAANISAPPQSAPAPSAPPQQAAGTSVPAPSAPPRQAASTSASSQQAAVLPLSPPPLLPLAPPPFRPLFAKGYNDLILRTYEELQRWENYLRDNPRRLLMKRARPEWLRPFFNLTIGSTTYSGIGNQSLLAAPRRIAVRVSRRVSPAQLAEDTARYMAAARQGAVLISPAISPGEKHVMRTAFDEGLPTVVIMENGFTPLSKPKGEQFDACAAGRLLMLAPWPHHNEKRKLTGTQCSQMNLMALELCQQNQP